MKQLQQLSKFGIALHWIVALFMLILTAVGFYMAEQEAWALYPLHKSFGIVAFIFIVLRISWRIKEGWPEPLTVAAAWQTLIAKLVHWGLLLVTLAMPVSGMVFSGASGHGFALFGWTIVPTHHAADDASKVVPYHEALADFGHEVHETLALVFLILLGLHLAGVIKHQFFDKDATLARMLGKR